MKKRLTAVVDKMLFDYPKIDDYVKERRESLEHPYIEPDENVGGGKGNKISKPIENIIISIDDDKILHGLVKQKNATYLALQKLNPEFLPVIERYYFYNQARFTTMDALIKKFNLPRMSFYRALNGLRHDILNNLSLSYLEWQCDASDKR